jgi:hypothetical protein
VGESGEHCSPFFYVQLCSVARPPKGPKRSDSLLVFDVASVEQEYFVELDEVVESHGANGLASGDIVLAGDDDGRVARV